MLDKWLVLIGSGGLICLIYWFFLGKSKKDSTKHEH